VIVCSPVLSLAALPQPALAVPVVPEGDDDGDDGAAAGAGAGLLPSDAPPPPQLTSAPMNNAMPSVCRSDGRLLGRAEPVRGEEVGMVAISEVREVRGRAVIESRRAGAGRQHG
jgi:hypothetical protein